MTGDRGRDGTHGGRLRKTLLALACLVVSAGPLWAQKAGDFGAGVILGDPTGVTAKYWRSDRTAIDAGIGFNWEPVMYADYLWHSWTVLPQPREGKIAAYLGLGAQLRDPDDVEFGLRAVAGAEYWLARYPIEIFVELVPVFTMTPHSRVGVDAGLGLRYYFGSW